MDHELAHALLRLAEFRNARIANRRAHEWQVTVALWALLAAAIIYLRIPRDILCALKVALVLVVLGHAYLWIGSHWAEARFDILVSFFYTDRAHEAAVPDVSLPQRQIAWPQMSPFERRLGFLAHRRCWAQILATGALAAGVWLAQGWPPLHS